MFLITITDIFCNNNAICFLISSLTLCRTNDDDNEFEKCVLVSETSHRRNIGEERFCDKTKNNTKHFLSLFYERKYEP